ncbi:chromosome segregation protein SMC [Thalassotalea sp. Y01]|uniref:chromosome segregation protein SMC n=1 Tax=Thalassotalea sp. Y01 TaxID=2729613 RepID=UPI00145FB663|nr:chromosome segregation protein SMC [Thalassotalea sp. Y01]NMP15624.1 chromosome segregation protein SMC [Thalassotalea sp. Y01]
MRLKKIKLAGFKSFVDVTNVPFEQDMTAIVGPNGCGKSNIIDAVRWVLGESSAKNLRGDSMTDVIFNGSTSRKPVGQASVELVFDNASQNLAGSMADRSEISIRRVVNRDSQNTYYLNGSKCRRKDITDIFLGTGLGPRSYAIIEQGMISRLIESKPQELRIFIEEAAGVSKYKERRRETENRIRHTRDNLLRLADIRQELAVNLEKLHGQSQAAIRFRELKAQERQLKAELAGIRYRHSQLKLQSLHSKELQLQTELEKLNAEQVQAEKDIIRARTRQDDSTDKLELLNQKKLAITSNIAGVEQNIKHVKAQKLSLSENNQRLQQSLQESKQLIEQHQQQQAELDEQLTQIEPELEIVSAQLDELTQQQMDISQRQQSWQRQWDEQQRQQADYEKRVAINQSQIDATNQLLLKTEQRLSQLTEQTSLVDVEQLQQQIEEAILSEQECSSRYQQHQAVVEECESALLTEQNKLQNLLDEVQQQKLQRGALQSQIDALNSINANQSDWQKRQSDYLQQQGVTELESVAQQLSVDAGWEVAVEMVLEHFLMAQHVEQWPQSCDLEQAVLVRNDTSTDKQPLPEAIPGQHTLLSKVAGGDALADKLAKVLVADTQDQAIELIGMLPDNSWSVICPQGLWLSKQWLRKGVLADSQGQLERHNRLKELTAQHHAAQQSLADTQQQLTLQQQIVAEQKLTLAQHIQQRGATNEALQQQQQTVHLKRQELELTNNQQGQIRDQIAAQQEQLQQEMTRYEELLIEQHNLSEDNTIDASAFTAMADEREQLLRQYQDSSSQHKVAMQRSQSLQLKQQKLTSELAAIEKANVRETEHWQKLQQQLEELEQQAKQNLQPLDEQQARLQTMLEERSKLDTQQSAINQQLQQSSQQIDRLNECQHNAMQRISASQQSIQDLLVDMQSYKLKAGSAKEQLAELQQDLDTILAALDSKASENQWQIKLARVVKSISALGAINLAAIEEFEQQSQRKNFLDQQNDDLQQALATLESAIAKIDRETRAKFKQTFEQVNNDLKVLFPKVFGGGSAYLELTGDDLLDTGVTIMARPPGKKNSTIHLLSGGEKALTALSLVFAIFRLNPAPFCMLDEVDAPLDDANVGRFCKLVEEMSQTVQFIYISHNKIAMEMASHLTGVTMYEPGVSRMVAVDIDEAVAMAEAV